MVGRLGAAALGWLLVAAAVGGTATVTAGAVTPAAGVGSVSPGTGATTAAIPETDSTVTRITLASNGTATWTVQVLTRLANDAEVSEYEAFQERFRENTSAFLDPFRDRMRGVVADAENATGRPMAAREFRARTRIQTVPRLWGVVTYEFQWVGFADREGDALAVGDVFRGQFYLTENDTLAIVGPGGYAVAAVDPQPAEQDARTVRWAGRRAFPEDTPAVRFEPRATPTVADTTTAGPDGTDTPAGGDGTDTAAGSDGTGEPSATDGGRSPTGTGRGASTGPDDGGSSLPAAAAVLVVGLAAIGVYRYYAGGAAVGAGTGDEQAGAAAGGVGTEAGAGAAGDRTDSAPADTAAADAGTATDESPSGDAVDGSEEGDQGPVPPGVDDDPTLTDADRVEQFLEAAGGQVRQSDVVDAFDWSKSKTSRVLSDMADAGRVEKLRIGRENVISLPDEDEADGDPDGRGGPQSSPGGSADGGDEGE